MFSALNLWISNVDFSTAFTIALLITFSFVIFLCKKFELIILLKSDEISSDSTQHGGVLVAQVLKDHGVKHIFTLIGGHISPILVAAEKLGIRVIDTRHEVTTVFAADAFARLSGTIGVAAVTAGPGVTNTITAVKNAQMAETPLLLLGGATASLLKGRGALQDIDQLSLVKSICKYSKSITCVRHIVPTLRLAIQEAFSGTPGPVFVELPLDILYPYKFVKQEMKVSDDVKGFIPRIMNQYLKLYLRYQFASAFETVDSTPIPINIPKATDDEVNKSRKLLSLSKKPLILLGSQSLIPPALCDQLIHALNILKIPCYLGGMARGLLGSNHQLYIRQKRRDALKEADFIILAGTVCDFRLSYGRILNKKANIVAINRDQNQLYKNSGVFWKPTIAIQGSAADFLIRLSAITSHTCNLEWTKLLQERDMETEKNNRELITQERSTYINPIFLLHELEKVLPENTILVADGGDFVATSSYILRPRGPLKWLDPGAFGTLGVGGGFALGAKICNPDATVIIIYGDGSCGYSIAEFDTFVRHKVPIIAIVGNDACWSQIAREQVPRFESDIACNLDYTDYHKVAEGFGAKGILLTGNETNQLASKLKSAILLSKEGHSVLVNALISKTDFRRGSISI